jgi:hypothetical protein
MKKLLPLFLISTLIGGGCYSSKDRAMDKATVIKPALTIEQAASTKTDAEKSPNLCTQEPTENDAGRLAYPIDPKYWNLPHLGQIFTALDCKDNDRVNKIKWMKDGSYTAGVTFSWGDAKPSEEMRSLLKEIGFTETATGLWQNKAPISLENLKRLHALFQNLQLDEMLEYEDCLDCG